MVPSLPLRAMVIQKGVAAANLSSLFISMGFLFTHCFIFVLVAVRAAQWKDNEIAIGPGSPQSLLGCIWFVYAHVTTPN